MKHVPRCDFNEFAHNLDATPSTSSPGTAITAGATPHVKTAFTSLIDPVPGDCYGFWLWFANGFLAATNSRALLDIAVSDSGVGAVAGDVILPNYLSGYRANVTFAGGAMQGAMFVPLFIPSGKRVSARWQSARASAVLELVVFLNDCSPSGQPPKVWRKADALGVTEASSQGTAIVSGSTGAESAWTAIGGTTSRAYEAFLPGFQGASDTTLTSLAHHIEYGADSTAWAERYAQVTNNESVVGPHPPAPIYRGAPAGTQMQVRAESGGTGEELDHALYGLY